MRMVSTFGWGAIALAGILLVPAAASGQITYTWNQPTSGGSWQSATNWRPNSGSPTAITDIAVFGSAATGPNAVTLSSSVSIAELRFDGANGASSTSAYTIGSNAQTITVNNGAGGLTVSGATTNNQIVAANVNAGTGVPLSIVNNGGSELNTLTISGAVSASTPASALNVSGWSNTTISGAIGNSIGTLTKDGPGVLTLSTANSYTGGTVISGGTISFSHSNQLGAGPVTLNGGALHISADEFITQNITLGANGGRIITTAGTVLSAPTVTGAITGSGPLTLDGGFYMFFTSNQAYTGPTIINNVGMTLVSGGQISATSAITVNGYIRGQIGILSLDNTGGASSTRVNDAAPVTLNGGLISIVPGIFSAGDETFGNLTVNGFGTLYGNQIVTVGGTASMNFQTLTRGDNFSTIYVGGPVTGPGAGTSVKIAFTGGITSPGGSGTSIGIIPWIGGDGGGVGTGAPTGFAETLYTYNNTNGLIALNSRASVNFVQIANTDPLSSGLHNALTGNPETLTSDLSIRSIVLNPDGTGSSTITGTGQTLTVSAGAIANVRLLRFNGPTLAFGANTGYLYLGANLQIQGSSSITGSNGIVATSNSPDGTNTLMLTNTINPNTFSGGLYLAGTATAEFNTSNSQLGAATGVISFRGGGLRYTGSSSVSLTDGVTDRPLQMFSAGGGLINVQESIATLTVPGQVTGAEQLTKQGSGTLFLANANNTYAGGTTIAEGTLAIAAPGSLGTGPLTIGDLAFTAPGLQFNGGGNYSTNIRNVVSYNLDTNGNNVILSGHISGADALVTKVGAGTLTLSGANSYSGNTNVDAGTLLVTNVSGSGTGAGAVGVFNNATLGGTGRVAGAVTVSTGGTLRPGLNGAGTLAVGGNTVLNSGAHLDVSLAAVGTNSRVNVEGGATTFNFLTGSILDLTQLPGFGSGGAYTLVSMPAGAGGNVLLNGTATTDGQVFGTFIQGTGASGAVTIVPSGFTLVAGDAFLLSRTGDSVLITFQPVPEPATVLGLAALALGGGALLRRRRAEAATAA